MTDLQASLIAIGGAIVAGVITYNKWQEYKAKKTVEKAFSAPADDVLMRSDAATDHAPANVTPGRHEPVLDDSVPSAFIAPSAADVMDSGAAEADIYHQERELPVDPRIDCLIAVSLDAPLRGEKLIPVLQTLRHVGNKPVHFVGENQDGSWESVNHGNAYGMLQAGVQLANRSGALNEIEYSELVMRLRQVADELGGEPDVPDMMQVMSAARELHQFVAEYDAQLSINVQSRGAPWPIATLLAALERQGFDLRPDGRLVMPDGDNGVLFSLSTNVSMAEETTTRLTLLLDVPRVAPEKDGFGAMAACSKMLAARLDGVVVDDTGQPLPDATLGEIAQQVRAFYSDMDTADIPAGSTRALRLFN